jgi:hypothetical protein
VGLTEQVYGVQRPTDFPWSQPRRRGFPPGMTGAASRTASGSGHL